jgi:hypothetical protein
MCVEEEVQKKKDCAGKGKIHVPFMDMFMFMYFIIYMYMSLSTLAGQSDFANKFYCFALCRFTSLIVCVCVRFWQFVDLTDTSCFLF